MGYVEADYDSDNKESKWEKVKKLLRGGKKSRITESRREGPPAARYKVGDIVRAPNWGPRCKVQEVRKDWGIWEYKLTKADDDEDYGNGEWQKEESLHPDS